MGIEVKKRRKFLAGIQPYIITKNNGQIPLQVNYNNIIYDFYESMGDKNLYILSGFTPSQKDEIKRNLVGLGAI